MQFTIWDFPCFIAAHITDGGLFQKYTILVRMQVYYNIKNKRIELYILCPWVCAVCTQCAHIHSRFQNINIFSKYEIYSYVMCALVLYVKFGSIYFAVVSISNHRTFKCILFNVTCAILFSGKYYIMIFRFTFNFCWVLCCACVCVFYFLIIVMCRRFYINKDFY